MFVIFVSLLILIMILFRFKWGLIFFIFLLPFLSRNLSIELGGLAFSPQRSAIILLVLFFLLHLSLKKKVQQKTFYLLTQHKTFTFTLLFLLIVKFGSTLLNSGIAALIYVADDALFSWAVFFMVFASFDSKKDEIRIFLAMLIGLMLNVFLIILEQIKGVPLLSGLIDIKIDVGKSLDIRERSGHQRSQALFDNPLLLAEFICLVSPVAFFVAMKFIGKIKFIAWITIVSIPMLLWAVYARSGLIVYLLGLCVFFYGTVWVKVGRRFRFILLIMVCGLSMIIVSTAYIVIVNPESIFDKSEQEGVSAIGRALQYVVVIDAVMVSPVIGFGLMQNFEKSLEFLNHLDNYWLRLLLEGGFLALLLFGALILIMIKSSFIQMKKESSQYEQTYYIMMLSFFCSFAIYKLFLSMPTNNVYFYLMAALFFLHKYNLSTKLLNAKV